MALRDYQYRAGKGIKVKSDNKKLEDERDGFWKNNENGNCVEYL